MTSGSFEREPKELVEAPFKMEDISPETLDRLKRTSLEPDYLVTRPHGGFFPNYGFVELSTDKVAEEALKPKLAGPEMLDILAGGDEPWGDVDAIIDLGVSGGGQKDQTDAPDQYELRSSYLVKSDMSAADVIAALERVRQLHDTTAVREGLRLNIDLTPPTEE